MDNTDTQRTVLAEQSQTPSQSGKNSSTISKDIGKNLSEETNSSGGGLDARLDRADIANAASLGDASKKDNSIIVGAEADAHNQAASKQP